MGESSCERTTAGNGGAHLTSHHPPVIRRELAADARLDVDAEGEDGERAEERNQRGGEEGRAARVDAVVEILRYGGVCGHLDLSGGWV